MNRKMKKRELEESLRRARPAGGAGCPALYPRRGGGSKEDTIDGKPRKGEKNAPPPGVGGYGHRRRSGAGGGSLLGYALLGRVESIATIDVNPSVELRIGRKEKVTGVTALNADAQGLLDGMDLKGTEPEWMAINALIVPCALRLYQRA